MTDKDFKFVADKIREENLGQILFFLKFLREVMIKDGILEPCDNTERLKLELTTLIDELKTVQVPGDKCSCDDDNFDVACHRHGQEALRNNPTTSTQ